VKAAPVLAVALALAASVPARASDPVRPLTLRQDLLGWEGVGRVELGDGYCTGALVSPDLVLTAAHCLFDGAVVRPRGAISFRAGDGSGEPVAERRIAQAVIAPGYDPAGADSAARIAADIALLQLDAPIPSATARTFRVDPAPSGGTVSVVSYGAGRDTVLSRQTRCNVIGRQIGILAFDCDVTFGSSGAPVFRIDGDSIRIVSIVSSGDSEEGGGIAFGPAFDGHVDALASAIRAGEGLWDNEAPASRRLAPDSGRAAGGARFLKP
jgi:protease YdgD